MMALSKELVENNDFATKRDAYYQSARTGARHVRRADRVRHRDGRHRGAVLAATASRASSCASSPTSTAARSPGELVVLDPDRETGEIERIDCTRFGSGAYSIPSPRRAPLLRDRGEVHPGDRDRRHVPAPAEPQVLADGRTASSSRWPACRRARRAASSASSPTSASSRSTPSSTATPTASPTSTARSRSARATPRTSIAVLLRAAGALPRRHAAGHRRLRAADAPAEGRRRQARQGRAQERPVLPGAQAVAARRSSSCSRWACAPSSRRWRSGASTT